MTALALAKAAEALVGSRFLLHGRDPRTGLDCIGVLAAALAAIGRPTRLPADYTLRSSDLDGVEQIAADCGFAPAQPPDQPGDVLLARTSPCQFHLLLAVGNTRYVHAHARLKRVVLSDGIPDWPVRARWRLAAAKEE